MPKGGMPGTPIPIIVTKLEGSMGGGGGGGAYITPVEPGGGGGGGGGAPGGSGGWTPGGGGTMDGVPMGGGGWAPDAAGCWGCCHGGRVPVARACNPSYREAEAGGSFELRSSELQRTMPIGCPH